MVKNKITPNSLIMLSFEGVTVFGTNKREFHILNKRELLKENFNKRRIKRE